MINKLFNTDGSDPDTTKTCVVCNRHQEEFFSSTESTQAHQLQSQNDKASPENKTEKDSKLKNCNRDDIIVYTASKWNLSKKSKVQPPPAGFLTKLQGFQVTDNKNNTKIIPTISISHDDLCGFRYSKKISGVRSAKKKLAADKIVEAKTRYEKAIVDGIPIDPSTNAPVLFKNTRFLKVLFGEKMKDEG